MNWQFLSSIGLKSAFNLPKQPCWTKLSFRLCWPNNFITFFTDSLRFLIEVLCYCNTGIHPILTSSKFELQMTCAYTIYHNFDFLHFICFYPFSMFLGQVCTCIKMSNHSLIYVKKSLPTQLNHNWIECGIFHSILSDKFSPVVCIYLKFSFFGFLPSLKFWISWS